jgi:hypothetical protein
MESITATDNASEQYGTRWYILQADIYVTSGSGVRSSSVPPSKVVRFFSCSASDIGFFTVLLQIVGPYLEY